jgi:uncharacterized protein with GYD domain
MPSHAFTERPLPKETRMITYIGLLSFTDKGLGAIKDTTKRAAAAKAAAKKTGVNMREVFWTLGEYDVICVLEAEDEAALAAFTIAHCAAWAAAAARALGNRFRQPVRQASPTDTSDTVVSRDGRAPVARAGSDP